MANIIMAGNKAGYYSSDETIDRPLSNSVSVSEQETDILYMRDQNYAEIYTSDSTQMTRLDKLCKKNPRHILSHCRYRKR